MSLSSRVVTVCACAFALLAGAPAAHAACTASTPATTTFADKPDDGGGAPEIKSVTVSVDAACKYTVDPGLTELTEDDLVFAYINADGNAATGASEPKGADVLVVTFGGDNPEGLALIGYWDEEYGEILLADALPIASSKSPGAFTATTDELAITPGADTVVSLATMRWSDDEDEPLLDWAPEPDSTDEIRLPVTYAGTATPPPDNTPPGTGTPQTQTPQIPLPTTNPGTTTPTTQSGCTVPKLRGKTRAAANSRLASAGCKRSTKVTKRYSSKVRKGRVIGTAPGTGKKTSKRVTLIVSKGRKPKRAH